MARFTDRVFLITGGARGLGAAQARRLVSEDGRVVIADVRVEEGERLAAELGPACAFVPLDVTSESQWRAAVERARQAGPLGGLVNNAGIFEPASIQDTDVALFERHLRVNQLGTFLGMQAVIPALEQAGGGSIVNISSTAGLRGIRNAIAYTGTKWAVRGMTKTAALELAPRKIRVNSVHPGRIDTDMLRAGGQAWLQSDAIPLKRLGRAEEVAGLVAYLLSDESAFMTGSELAIDGGGSL